MHRLTAPFRLAVAAATIAALVLVGLRPAAAAGGITVKAAIDGRDVSRSSNGHPIVLRPATTAILDLDVTNGTAKPLSLQTVRLAGHVIGLTFYSYDITVNVTVDPGASTHLTLPVALGGLRAQATGLIAGTLQLLGAGDATLASIDAVTDVRGSATSVYGVFGLAIGLIAALGIGGALVGLARRTLPRNRFVRALRFAAPFAALGLLVVFTLSAFRVLVPKAASELPIVLVAAAIGFAIGYLSPAPGTAGDDEDDDAAPAPAAAVATAPAPVPVPATVVAAAVDRPAPEAESLPAPVVPEVGEPG